MILLMHIIRINTSLHLVIESLNEKAPAIAGAFSSSQSAIEAQFYRVNVTAPFTSFRSAGSLKL